MINTSVNTLLQLLRLALGNKDECSLPSDIDWQEVIDLSFDQCVAAISVDGFGSTLSPTWRMVDGSDLLDSPKLEDLKYEWFGEVFAREEEYKEQVKAIRQLLKLWAENGLKVYALKGLSFAQYYPFPEHRYSCDFDCNVRFASSNLPAWDIADRIAKENGILVDDDQSKHSRFVVNGVSVENHRHVLGVNGSRKQKRFDSYLQGLLNDSGKELMTDLPLVAPCWLFNALFCIAHAQVHFLEEDGILLKHVLDWVQIRKAPEAVAYQEQFERDIDRFGLCKFFDALDGVADLIDGLVFMGEGLTESQRRMLEDIFAPKDVRHFKSTFLAYLNILRMIWTNRWKFRLYSETTDLATMWRYVYGHFFDNDLPR